MRLLDDSYVRLRMALAAAHTLQVTDLSKGSVFWLGKKRSADRCMIASSWRSKALRLSGSVWIRFSSIARNRRATWMLWPPKWRISVTAS